eukprot:scaffold1734_cov113-Isochrysis_galbana.AAC.4
MPPSRPRVLVPRPHSTNSACRVQVIVSIFIYGSKVEQLLDWLAAAGAAVGLSSRSAAAAYESVPTQEMQVADEDLELAPTEIEPPGHPGTSTPAGTNSGGGKGQ